MSRPRLATFKSAAGKSWNACWSSGKRFWLACKQPASNSMTSRRSWWIRSQDWPPDHRRGSRGHSRYQPIRLGRRAKAYVGVYPRRRQSGTREGYSTMARHGNPLLRACLWNAARAAVIHKHPLNPFRALFDRLIAKGKLYGQAIGAVVRKLVQTVYGVLKSQTPFYFPQS